MSDPIDAYLDDHLAPAERAAFEARLHEDPDLRARLATARELRESLAALPREVTPERDLWPQVVARLDTDRRGSPWLVVGLAGGGLVLALALLAAIGLIGGAAVVGTRFAAAPNVPAPVSTAPVLSWDRSPQDGPIAIGHAHLRNGDLPAAHAAFEASVQAHPGHPDALIALAYTTLLQGDHDAADRLLERAEDRLPPSQHAEVKLRRALVAFDEGRLDDLQRHARASGLPAGLVLAAEVYLHDADQEEAAALLQRAEREASDARVRQTARDYLDQLEDGESVRSLLAEATAVWALGSREDALEIAADLLTMSDPGLPQRDDLLLLWAGRAAAAGRGGLAEELLDTLGGPPAPDQIWRVHATRAIVAASRGEIHEAVAIFDALEAGGAPLGGLRDARLTAAVISPDPDARRELVAGLDGPGAALISRDPSRLDRLDTPLGRYLSSP